MPRKEFMKTALVDQSGNKGVERIRWRTRRGLLELDIVLGGFVQRHYAGLDEAGRSVFDALLDMPDTELWDMITGKIAPPDKCIAVVKLLQAV